MIDGILTTSNFSDHLTKGIVNTNLVCPLITNQHGWSKYSLATLVHENTDCTFSDSQGCIFTVN